MTKLSTLFDTYLKTTSFAFSQDDLVIYLGRWSALSSVEMVCFAYCLIYSQNKIIQIAARKALKSRLPDVRNSLSQFVEVSEEIRLGLMNFIQCDDVSLISFCLVKLSSFPRNFEVRISEGLFFSK